MVRNAVSGFGRGLATLIGVVGLIALGLAGAPAAGTAAGLPAVVAWGSYASGQTAVPGGLSGIVAVSAGTNHTVALRTGGSVVAWGSNSDGQAAVPPGLTNVVAVAAGGYHNLALRADGTVVAWGSNVAGQSLVPSGLSHVTAIAAGGYHSLALKSDGTVVAWGMDLYGQVSKRTVLGSVTAIAIAAGQYHSLALRADGTVVGWGQSNNGETVIPSGLKNVTAIAAGGFHSLALRSDGTVVAWGSNTYGQRNVPAALGGVVRISAGGWHSLAVRADGTVTAWGRNDKLQLMVPVGLTGVSMVAAGQAHSVALRGLDTTPPLLQVPGQTTLEATSAAGAVARFTATATDEVDPAPVVACSPASGATFPLGDTTVTCSGTDAAGNRAEAEFVVTVQDTTPPLLQVPDRSSLEAASAAGALVSFTASATDEVDPAPVVVCSPPSGATAPLGDTTVSCSAADAAGNRAQAAFVVTVQDTTSPILQLPDPIIAEAASAAGAPVQFAATALDLADPSPVVQCSPAPGSLFAPGDTTVSCTTTDAAGNRATGEFAVSVVDTTPPEIRLPAEVEVEATGPEGAQVAFPAAATDSADPQPELACTPGSGSRFAVGRTEVSCQATDRAGNSTEASFAVVVEDSTAPEVTALDGWAAAATGSDGAVVHYRLPLAEDLVSGALTPDCQPAPGSRFPLGTSQVACVATDEAGNSAHATYPMRVTYSWSGLLAPLETAGSVVKGGSAPVKFALTGPSAGVSTADARLYVARATGAPQWTPATGTGSAKDSNRFRYDPASAQYLFNWATKGLAAGPYLLRVDLGDEVAHTWAVSVR